MESQRLENPRKNFFYQATTVWFILAPSPCLSSFVEIEYSLICIFFYLLIGMVLINTLDSTSFLFFLKRILMRNSCLLLGSKKEIEKVMLLKDHLLIKPSKIRQSSKNHVRFQLSLIPFQVNNFIFLLKFKQYRIYFYLLTILTTSQSEGEFLGYIWFKFNIWGGCNMLFPEKIQALI